MKIFDILKEPVAPATLAPGFIQTKSGSALVVVVCAGSLLGTKDEEDARYEFLSHFVSDAINEKLYRSGRTERDDMAPEELITNAVQIVEEALNSDDPYAAERYRYLVEEVRAKDVRIKKLVAAVQDSYDKLAQKLETDGTTDKAELSQLVRLKNLVYNT